MDHNELKNRTKLFAIRIIKFSQYLEKNCGNVGRKIGDQILRSGIPIYANYRASCRCKSAKDFISKMGTVVEKSDETLGWLELLVESSIIETPLVENLIKEANEITAIMTASRTSAIKNQKEKDL